MFKYSVVASDPPSSQELNDALGRWNTALMLLHHSLSIEGKNALTRGNDWGNEVGAGRSLNLPSRFLCCSASH